MRPSRRRIFHWRDDRRVVRFSRGEAPPHSDQQGPRLCTENHGADGAAPSTAFGSVSPNQRIHLSLVWPICGSCHQAGPHGVSDHISPLVVVAFLSSQLGLPEIALPDWRVLRLWPMSRGMGFPIRNPLLKRWRLRHCRRAKQVQVIWHEHIPANNPRIGFNP